MHTSNIARAQKIMNTKKKSAITFSYHYLKKIYYTNHKILKPFLITTKEEMMTIT